MDINRDNAIFFKCRFFSESKVYYGFLYYIIDPNNSSILRSNMIVSRFRFFLSNHFPSEYISNISLFDVEVKLKKIKEDNEYHVITTSKVSAELNSHFKNNADERYDFINLIKQKKDLDLHYKLQYLFKRILNVGDMSFEFSFDEISMNQIQGVSEDISNKEDKEFKKNLTNFQREILNIEETYSKNFKIKSAIFILAPYTGISINKLKIGDPVVLYLSTGNFFNYADGNEEEIYDKTNAVNGIIDKIIAGPINQFFFMIQIDRHTYARVLETENFNIKLSTDKKDEILYKILSEDLEHLGSSETKVKFKKELFLSFLGIIFIIIILYLLYY